jgi:ABC-type multidrug transport system fused ATPase/permease subunit
VVTNVYNKMRMAISDIPLHVQELLKAQTSLARIVTFLNDEEVQAGPTTVEQRVQVQGATLAWPSASHGADENAFRLEDVNLDIEPGLTVISGPLGSGKTLLVCVAVDPADASSFKRF